MLSPSFETACTYLACLHNGLLHVVLLHRSGSGIPATVKGRDMASMGVCNQHVIDVRIMAGLHHFMLLCSKRT